MRKCHQGEEGGELGFGVRGLDKAAGEGRGTPGRERDTEFACVSITRPSGFKQSLQAGDLA